MGLLHRLLHVQYNMSAWVGRGGEGLGVSRYL